jgi:AmiR/NasT family two-component response regulator
VQNAQILAQAHRLIANLQHALVSCAVIDQAIGIIISRTGGTADEAFEGLRTVSQTQHTKMSVVAARTVDTAARRARARPDDH